MRKFVSAILFSALVLFFCAPAKAEQQEPKNKGAVQKGEDKNAPKKTDSPAPEEPVVTAYEQDIQAVPKGLGRYKWNIISLFGIFVPMLIALALSINRKILNKRLIIWGVALQITFAILILHTYPGLWFFDKARVAVDKIVSFTSEGASFVFGALSNRTVMNDTIQNRNHVYVDPNGFAYVNGAPLSNRDYAGFLKAQIQDPKQRASFASSSWPATWEKDWDNKGNLSLPPEIVDKPVSGIKYEGAYQYSQWMASSSHPARGFVFTFQILTTIIFFGAFMSVLYHLGIMQMIVFGMAKVMAKTMGTSGAESISCAANVFVGQTEAPLVVKPYVSRMTQSELMALMTGGFATMAGGVLVAYASFGVSAGHLLSASVMAAPCALLMAKIMVPETEEPVTAGKVTLVIEKETANVIDAAASGASDGMRLAINVAAMLLAFIALIAMVNWMLEILHSGIALLGIESLTYYWPKSISGIFGYIFYPVAVCIGVPVGDAFKFADLVGIKLVLTEFIAYLNLTFIMPSGLVDTNPNVLSTRAVMMATYALCGFANFGSIAIQLGGIGGIAPDRRQDLARLGLRAMFAGALVSLMTAAIAGVLLTPQETDWRYGRELAMHQVENNMGKDPLALADFAKPFYQYSKLYPNENEKKLQNELQNHLKEIFSFYKTKHDGEFQALRFAKIFQARYPRFSDEIHKTLKEMGQEGQNNKDQGLVNFVENLQKKF